MEFRTYSAWEELPAGYDALLDWAGAQEFCLGRAWFEALAATTLEAGERLVIAGVESDAVRPPVWSAAGASATRRP